MCVRQPPPELVGDGALVRRVAVGVEEADRDRLGVDRLDHARDLVLGQLDQDAVAAEYAAADIFVLPSISEPWGMVLNEAAAAGLPLIATDACGAAWELIEDGANGFRVPAADAQALRDAIAELEDPERRATFGARSREIAARFTPEAWAAAVAGLARELTS